MELKSNINNLIKALEGGNYNAAPGSLVQGSALQVEDLSPIMHNVTFEKKHIMFQRDVKNVPCKSTLAQFDRQLSYGSLGGSAQWEGAVGQEETSTYVRAVVPMSYYAHIRRVTLVANLVSTVDGKKASDRAGEDAALKIAGDMEFDMTRGQADFSNGGVFDGNPATIAAQPNMHGMDLQIRQSDAQRSTQDLMFSEFGSDETVVIGGGGTLDQNMIEDGAVRSDNNFGNADELFVSPKVLANYNKVTRSMERIVLSGSPTEATGSSLKKQWVSGGTISLEASHFLRGKEKPAMTRSTSPAAPTSVSGVAAAGGGLPAGTYAYFATSCNEQGESGRSTAATTSVVVTLNQKVTLTITHPSAVVRWFNVYRSAAGGSADSAKFIGKVKIADGAATTDFVDLNNKQPGFVTGFLLQKDSMEVKELSPYSRVKLAVGDLSENEAHFRFACLAMFKPRVNVLFDNLR